MIGRTSYTYTVLRYRHDPLGGEFVNVGVILHAPKLGYLGARLRHTYSRVKQVFPDLDADAFKSSLRSVERSIRRLSSREGGDLLGSISDASSFAQRVLPNDDSSLVWSQTGSGITKNPAETLEQLYDRLVARYDRTYTATRNDEDVWRPVRDGLVARRLIDRLEPKTIRSPIDEVVFQHAWKNGSWHCFQPLSFDLASDDSIKDKAHRWAGQLVGLESSPEDFRPYFFVGGPAEGRLSKAYEGAIAILKLGSRAPSVIEERDADKFLNLIETKIRAGR